MQFLLVFSWTSRLAGETKKVEIFKTNPVVYESFLSPYVKSKKTISCSFVVRFFFFYYFFINEFLFLFSGRYVYFSDKYIIRGKLQIATYLFFTFEKSYENISCL